MPRGVYERKQMTESNEVFSGSERDVSVSKGLQDTTPEVEPVSAQMLANAEQMDRAKFMGEMLEVYLQDPMNDQDSKFCFVGVQGNCLWLKRGGTYQIPRSHVEVLARAKAGRIVQTRQTASDGSQSYVEKEVLNLQYPFTVISDPSGQKGSAWLRAILKQAA